MASRTMRTAIIILIPALFLLTACQAVQPTPAAANTATAPVASPTIQASETPRPPTSTPVPPTATVPPVHAILPELKQACQSVENQPVMGGHLTLPLAALRQEVSKGSAWDILPLVEAENGLIARDAPAIQTVACIREDYILSSKKYTDGKSAYMNDWKIWLVSWPSGDLIGQIRLTNSPPFTKTHKGDAYAEPPVEDFLAILGRSVTNADLFLYEHDKGFADAVLSADGNALVKMNRDFGATWYNLIDGQVSSTFVTDISSQPALEKANPMFLKPARLVLSPGGDLLAISLDHPVITLLVSAADGSLVAVLQGNEPVFSPASGLLAVVQRGTGNYYDIVLYDTAGKVADRLQTQFTNPGDLAFSANGRWLVMTSASQVAVWDMESKRPVSSYEDKEIVFRTALMSPDGRFVVLGSSSGLFILDVQSQSIVFSTPDNSLNYPALDLSPDGRYLAFVDPDFVPHLLDLNDYQKTPVFSNISGVKRFAFHPDGKLLYLIDGSGTAFALNLEEATSEK